MSDIVARGFDEDDGAARDRAWWTATSTSGARAPSASRSRRAPSAATGACRSSTASASSRCCGLPVLFALAGLAEIGGGYLCGSGGARAGPGRSGWSAPRARPLRADPAYQAAHFGRVYAPTGACSWCSRCCGAGVDRVRPTATTWPAPRSAWSASRSSCTRRARLKRRGRRAAVDPADHLRRPWRVHASRPRRGSRCSTWEVAIQLPAVRSRWVEAPADRAAACRVAGRARAGASDAPGSIAA